MEETEKEKRESRRSMVRISVTYSAAFFLFAGGFLMVAYLLIGNQYQQAKEIFLTVLPVSAAIVSYWFAGRSPGKSGSGGNGTESGVEGKTTPRNSD